MPFQAGVILGNSLLNESKKVFYTPQYITNKWQEEKKKEGELCGDSI